MTRSSTEPEGWPTLRFDQFAESVGGETADGVWC